MRVGVIWEQGVLIQKVSKDKLKLKYLYRRIIGEKWQVHRNQDLTELQ